MNAFQKRNLKLLVDPVEQGISCFEQDEKPTKESVRSRAYFRKAEPFFNHQTVYFGQCIFYDQPKMTLPFKA